ncbi:MAG: hypothetical protein LBU32_28020 [Clostridiales bacterium]|nr:hypothetical protein [Clostridiales bacterium]
MAQIYPEAKSPDWALQRMGRGSKRVKEENEAGIATSENFLAGRRRLKGEAVAQRKASRGRWKRMKRQKPPQPRRLLP